MTSQRVAKFGLGQIVRHRDAMFRGVVIDIDPCYIGDPDGSDEGLKDEPHYQVLAIGANGGFAVYAAESVLDPDPELSALTREAELRWFNIDAQGRHAPLAHSIH